MAILTALKLHQIASMSFQEYLVDETQERKNKQTGSKQYRRVLTVREAECCVLKRAINFPSSKVIDQMECNNQQVMQLAKFRWYSIVFCSHVQSFVACDDITGLASPHVPPHRLHCHSPPALPHVLKMGQLPDYWNLTSFQY